MYTITDPNQFEAVLKLYWSEDRPIGFVPLIKTIKKDTGRRWNYEGHRPSAFATSHQENSRQMVSLTSSDSNYSRLSGSFYLDEVVEIQLLEQPDSALLAKQKIMGNANWTPPKKQERQYDRQMASTFIALSLSF